MKTQTITLWILALLAALIMAGCGGGGSDAPDGDTPDGDTPDGDVDGDEPDGDTDGDVPDGDKPDGDVDGDTDGDVDGDDDGEEVDVQEDIDLGVFWLENGENVLANEVFMRALEADPSSANARFGAAFSEAMIGFDTFFMVIAAVEGQINKNEDTGLVARYAADNDYEGFADWLDQEFPRALLLMSDSFDRAAELYEPLKESGGVSLRFEHLPVTYSVQEITWLTGEIDDADVYLFDSMARTFSALLHLVIGNHIKTDLYGVMSLLKSQVQGDTNLQTILGIVVYLLEFDEAFLSLRDDAPATIEGVRDNLAIALEDVLLAAQAAEDELESDPDQSDEIFTIVENRDKSLTLNLNVWRVDSATDEPIMNSIEIVTPDVAVAAGQVRSQLLNGGDPLPFEGPISQTLCSVLMLPLGFGLFEWFGLDVKELLGFDYDMITPDLLESLLTGVLKLDVIAVDLHAWFEDPVALRDVLPVWTTDREFLHNVLVMEWECPDELLDDGLPDGTGGIFCAGEEDTLVDSAHFTDYQDYSIAADGHTVKTPYMAFQDPTFGGVLYVDPGALKLDGYPDEPQFQQADQLSANAALAKILSGILTFVGK